MWLQTQKSVMEEVWKTYLPFYPCDCGNDLARNVNSALFHMKKHAFKAISKMSFFFKVDSLDTSTLEVKCIFLVFRLTAHKFCYRNQTLIFILLFVFISRLSNLNQALGSSCGILFGTPETQTTKCACCGKTLVTWDGRTRCPTAGIWSTGLKWDTWG